MIKDESKKYVVDNCILVIFAFIINYIYGSIGVLSQDTFAYFDTSYRVLQGSIPFVDYWTVSGPFIDFFQATIFYILGVSWKSYILSGSLINILITILLYNVLREYKLSRKINLFYCLCFSILANPSMGVPFPDHFSSFFSLGAILLFLILIKKKDTFYWTAIPFLFFIAFFSKQTPATYLLFSFLIILAFYLYLYKKINFIKYFILSSFLCLSIFILFLYINSINFENFINQYILFPRTIGEERLDNYKFSVNSVLNNFKFIYFALIFVLINIFFQFKNNRVRVEKDRFIINITLILVSLSFIFHQILTMNFIYIFFLIPLIAGLTHSSYFKNKKIHSFFGILLILMTTFTTAKYHLRFNENRKMLNLEKINLDISVDSIEIDRRLKGLKWITKNYSKNPAKEIVIIKDIIEKIKEDQNKIMLYSHYLFLSAITDKDLNSPTRWPSQADASNPSSTNKFHPIYLKFVKNLVEKKNIAIVYSTIEEKHDIFNVIFDEKCRKSEEINEVLKKHDIRNCYKLK
jgi:hypothetical protein